MIQTSPIRQLADLDRFWRSLAGPWGFALPQVWCVVLDPGGELTPGLIKIEECPDAPDAEMVDTLMRMVDRVVREKAPGGSAALMFARPGADDQRVDDRLWARRLTEAGQRVAIDVWPVFLANDRRVRVAAPDDLAA